MARYWAELPDKTAAERCDGLAFSILVAIDGYAMAMPGLILALNVHPDDKAYCIGEGDNWYVPGQVINADCALHEDWNQFTLERDKS